MNIGTIDCTPEIDPYHRDTQGLTLTTLHIDPADETVHITQEYDDNATPEAVWNGRIIERALRCDDALLDADKIREYITSSDGQALLQRIVDGHSWNGHIGTMTNDAAEALNTLVEELESYTSDVEVWTVENYFREITAEMIAEMTDADIERLITEIGAEDNHVIIGDVRDYIAKLQND